MKVYVVMYYEVNESPHFDPDSSDPVIDCIFKEEEDAVVYIQGKYPHRWVVEHTVIEGT